MFREGVRCGVRVSDLERRSRDAGVAAWGK